MRITQEIDTTDVTGVKALFEEQRDNRFIKNRIECNLRPDKPAASVDDFWKILVGCLLTTQQPSGSGRPVHRFINKPCGCWRQGDPVDQSP